MGVTIRDVAAASGVSLMAVSKVLHGRGAGVRVSEKTAEHIRKVAEQLGYRPNALARGLRLGKTDTIGLIFQGFENLKQGYYVELLQGIMGTAFGAGYSLTICPKLMNPDSPSVLNDGRFDGVIWSKMLDDPEMRGAIEVSRVPIVALHVPASAGLQNVSTICCDNDEGLDLAVAHLYGLGHRRILFAYESVHARLLETVARTSAFAGAMNRRGLSAGPEDLACWKVEADDFGEWWRAHPPHTAIITRGEWFAGQILEQAGAAGVSVPSDLSLICFDSTDYSKSRRPSLTAIRQPISEMAVDATKLLLRQIAAKTRLVETLSYPCTLDVRESTAVAPDRVFPNG
jgi:DNA-binding LacI/PurR family transcriptional regulator